MRARCWCPVSARALRSNLLKIKEKTGRRVIAVVKADAYGHWARQAVKALAEADYFAVATINEALEIYPEVDKPILILYPLCSLEETLEAARRGIRLNVGSWESLRLAKEAAKILGAPVPVHVEFDTGLGRTGFLPQEASRVAEEARSLDVEGVFTHFYDSCNRGAVLEQLEKFREATKHFPGALKHAASSGAILTAPESWLDAVRPGITLYGELPCPELRDTLGLEPALSFKARVIQVKELPPGHGVSYGPLYRTGKPQRVAVVAVGYEDGFPPNLSNRWFVLIKGVRRPILGAVAMDAVMVDASGEPPVRVGDVATVIGDGVRARDIALASGTSVYDVLTSIGRRAIRVYRNL